MACRNRCLWALTLTLLLLGARQAAPQTTAGDIRTIQLQLRPKGESPYALEYHLRTPYMEQRAGNAAPLYEIALSLLGQYKNEHPYFDENKLGAWLSDPGGEIPTEEVQALVADFERMIHYLDMASRTERCVWEYPVREEGLRCPTPDLSGFRTLCRVLALKARLEVAAGDVTKALDTVRIGLAVGHDLGGGPFIVQTLLGAAGARRVLAELVPLIQRDDAPNLYWALASLPRPFADMRSALEMESDALYAVLPELKTLDTKVLSNEQVTQLWRKVLAMTSPGSDADSPGQWMTEGVIMAGAMSVYPEAKRYLVDMGRDTQEIESLPALHVVLLYERDQFQRFHDEICKWCYLPYWQVRERLSNIRQIYDRYFQKHGNVGVVAGAFAYSMPVYDLVYLFNVRVDRDIAMLQCVEAIRMYAADHAGKLPASLEQITAVPVPVDPFYGRPFTYRVVAGKGVLTSPPPSEDHMRDALRYEITIK